MKQNNKGFLFGLPTILLVLGLVLAGCDDGSTGGTGNNNGGMGGNGFGSITA